MAEVAEADRLYDANQLKELHEYLLQFSQSEDPELLWRSARAYRDRSVMSDVTEEQKKQLVMDGVEVAKRALEFGETISGCHKWYGVLLSRTGDYLGNKVRISNAPTIKSHFEKAAELNPSDVLCQYLIGMWCFQCASLGWAERKIASALFGTPPSSTFEEALEHYLKAEEMKSGFYSDNQLQLGLTYLKLGKKDEAKEWFTKLLSYDAKTDEDRAKIAEAQKQLKSLK